MTTATHTFNATGLLSRYGFGDGDMPDAVYEHLATVHGGTVAEDCFVVWRSQALVPVVRDLLIPALPVTVEHYTVGSTLHNPIRATKVNGKAPTNRKDWGDVSPLLANYMVTLPVAFLADLVRGEATLDGLADVPLGTLNAAVDAGIPVAEIPALHASGALDRDALAALRGLRA